MPRFSAVRRRVDRHLNECADGQCEGSAKPACSARATRPSPGAHVLADGRTVGVLAVEQEAHPGLHWAAGKNKLQHFSNGLEAARGRSEAGDEGTCWTVEYGTGRKG